MKKLSWMVISLGFAGVLMTACGSAQDAASAAASSGSCEVSNTSGLMKYCMYSPSGTAAISSACTMLSSGGVTATYSSSACSTTGEVGKCTISSTGIVYILKDGFDNSTAAAFCSNQKGTYTSG